MILSLPRRRSLLIKILLLVPVTWFVLSMLFANNERIQLEKAEQQQQNDPAKDTPELNINVIKAVASDENNHVDSNDGDVVAGIAAGRQPRQSQEDISANRAQLVQEQAAVLLPPRDNEGPGELGKPFKLPANQSDEHQRLVKLGWEKNAFNQYVSDLISLHRSLPDVRPKGCQDERYETKDLPPTSVIVCFHNEAWSVLLRTVHSIIDRSPQHLLEEIILVDDFSDLPHLGQQLEDYLLHLDKVKVIRAKRREGLIRARLLGASVAKAPVLTYLDSHCECAYGWLEPLLQRIHNNWTTVVCPVIDVINDDTFEYHYKDAEGIHVGGFDWNLQFNWHLAPERERKRRAHTWDPLWTPTMAGGLFAIDKKFFERLGTYDSGFDIWGGENLELSFKTWMCGGTLEIVPCSHVGHIFRKRSPYKWRSDVNVLKRNSVRLAEVWLDDFRQYYYKRIGNDLGDFGDVQSRKDLRNKLKCKSFDWYLKNIYPEQFIPGDAVASGEIRNLGQGSDTCIDSPGRKDDLHKAVGLYPCHQQGGNQFWMLTKDGEIRRDEACMDYAGGDVILYPCHGSKGNQLWVYDPNTHSLQHGSSRRCLAISQDKQRLLMEDCTGEERQKWTFENYDSAKAANVELS